MEDKDTPLPFHFLDTLEPQGGHTLESREHILCVYGIFIQFLCSTTIHYINLGDNFFQSVKYKISFLPLNSYTQPAIEKIRAVEPVLITKKKEMQEFQREYMDLKRKYSSISLFVKLLIL
jgi:hypothetical protein